MPGISSTARATRAASATAGHAVGIEIHENPRYSPTCSDIIQSGMVMTIEPGIYLPGKFGVRIEDTTFVRPDGCEIVGKSPKELIVL